MTRRSVAIDFLPESVARHRDCDAIVVVDVIRATTSVVTAVAAGRRCFPARSVDAALELRARIENALLVGEIDGHMPNGFDLSNSPAALAARTDVERPMILLSSSGTRLICEAATAAPLVYVACLRNVTSQIDSLLQVRGRIAVIGAGSRGEFRREDQLGCAQIAAGLLAAGFEPASKPTAAMAERWKAAGSEMFVQGASAEYLRRSGQERDLDFIREHVDDVDAAFVVRGDEVVAAPTH